jgi:hypothetical protein
MGNPMSNADDVQTSPVFPPFFLCASLLRRAGALAVAAGHHGEPPRGPTDPVHTALGGSRGRGSPSVDRWAGSGIKRADGVAIILYSYLLCIRTIPFPSSGRGRPVVAVADNVRYWPALADEHGSCVMTPGVRRVAGRGAAAGALRQGPHHRGAPRRGKARRGAVLPRDTTGAAHRGLMECIFFLVQDEWTDMWGRIEPPMVTRTPPRSRSPRRESSPRSLPAPRYYWYGFSTLLAGGQGMFG